MILPTSEQTLPLPAYYIQQLKETEQNPRYHAEGNVYNHTLLVLQQFEKGVETFQLNPEEKLILYWAAILHDIGKPVVTHWREGRWRASGHEEAGVPIARNLLLQNPDINASQRRKILDLVNFHQIPLRWGLAKREVEDYKKLATKTDLRLLGIFAYFDLMGRICEDHERIYELITHLNEVIVPRVIYETGTFDQIQQRYSDADVQHKNALWQSLKFKDVKLMEKLLQSYPKQVKKGIFQCFITIGADIAGQIEYISDRFPDFASFYLPELLSENLSKHEREKKLREVKHFLSVYGREGRSLVVTGTHTDEAVRQQVVEFARLLGAQINYLFFDQALDDILLKTDNPEAEKLIRENYTRLRYPHPWEAHTMELVPSTQETDDRL
ncbi:MAG: HD domain-containing protein [Bacteroidia bacterium]|nr:HD domain-containing protein [Bacteroidia bacterium]